MAIKIEKVDLTRKRGDTYADQFRLAYKNGQPLDIAGATFKLAVNSEEAPVDTTNQIFELVGVVVDEANAWVEFAPSEAQVSQENIGNWYFDAQVTYANGRHRTFAQGKYSIEQDIAK